MTDTALPAPRRLMPTPMRPLLGLTLLVVEDSRFASEAVRQMCLASGARLRRADSLAAARRHLAIYAPSVCLIDLGLPDGEGTELFADLARSGVPVLASSGDDGARARAHSAGAQGFLPKPIRNLSAFQQAVLDLLPVEARPRGPRLVDETTLTPDPLAYRDDLDHARTLLQGSPDAPTRAYLAQFLDGVARCAGDDSVAGAAAALASSRGTANDAALSRLRAHVDERLAEPMPL